MNSYIKIIIITFILTIFSFLIELNYKCINNLEKSKIFNLFILRYIHYILLIFFSTFLLFFNYKSIDGIIYLIIAIIMSLTWYFFECCIISYNELKMYNVDFKNYDTTFHPCMYVLFRKYQHIPLIISGIIMALTYYYILYYNENIIYINKIIFFILFSYLFIDSFIKSRYNNKTSIKQKTYFILFFLKFNHILKI